MVVDLIFSFSWLQPALAFSLRIYSKAGWYEDFRLRRVLDLDKFRHWIVEQPSSIVGHADACSQSHFH